MLHYPCPPAASIDFNSGCGRSVFFRSPNSSSVINCFYFFLVAPIHLQFSWVTTANKRLWLFWKKSLLLWVFPYCISWEISSTSLVSLILVICTPNCRPSYPVFLLVWQKMFLGTPYKLLSHISPIIKLQKCHQSPLSLPGVLSYTLSGRPSLEGAPIFGNFNVSSCSLSTWFFQLHQPPCQVYQMSTIYWSLISRVLEVAALEYHSWKSLMYINTMVDQCWSWMVDNCNSIILILVLLLAKIPHQMFDQQFLSGSSFVLLSFLLALVWKYVLESKYPKNWLLISPCNRGGLGMWLIFFSS